MRTGLIALLVFAAGAQAGVEQAVEDYLEDRRGVVDTRPTRTAPRYFAIVPGGDLGDAPDYTDGSATKEQVAEDEKRWSSFLPIMGDKVREMGHELPLPFGASFSLMYLRRDIKVTSIKVGIDGAPPQEVDFISVDADSEVINAMFRLDAWILPFLNIYGLLGYTKNESTSDVTVQLPGPGGREISFEVPSNLDGPTYGVAITLAAGYSNFFLTGDANYTFTDLQAFDSAINVLIVSLRTGWFGKIGNNNLRFWTGVMYWDTAREITGEIDIPTVGTVRYEVEQGPVTEWTIILGANWEVRREIALVLEVQFLADVFMLVGSFTYRF